MVDINYPFILFTEFGIFRFIKTNRACNHLYRKYLSLPFIPVKEMVERVRSLRRDIKFELEVRFRKGFRAFHKYIKNYWIRKVCPERISVFAKSRRTNNGLEVLHSLMAKRLAAHSNVFRFIDGLERTIFVPTLAKIRQIKAGNTNLYQQTKKQRERET